jgi:DNA-binding NarL/FixJ family response regulator
MIRSPDEDWRGQLAHARGNPWITIGTEHRRVRRLPSDSVFTQTERLSPRESIIAWHVANGEAHKVIALTYSLSIQAVSTYLKRAKEKLGVHSQVELVRALGGTPTQLDQRPEACVQVRTTKKLANPTDLLTHAQSNVLVGLLDGERHAEIAASLGITKRTVAAHVSAIMHRIGVSSRAELLATLFAVPDLVPRIGATRKPRR